MEVVQVVAGEAGDQLGGLAGGRLDSEPDVLHAALARRAEDVRRLLLAAGGGGAIVNTSSGAGVFASANIAHYAAAKHGVIGLTRSAAIEYGEHGVRINAVCPGLVDTPMRARSLAFDPEQAQRTLAFSGGRVNPPELIADTAVWLCREEASNVNGQALLGDGKYGPELRLGSRQHWVPLEQLTGG